MGPLDQFARTRWSRWNFDPNSGKSLGRAFVEHLKKLIFWWFLVIFRILPVRYAFQESTTRWATAAGITDERGWTKFSLCKKFHRKIFPKHNFSIEKKSGKYFSKKVKNFEILIFWSKSWTFWYFDFLTYKKSKSQNF